MNKADPIVLITGANKGIGFEIAQQLAAKGLIVLVGARSRQAGEKAVADLAGDSLDVRHVQIDLNDEQSIAEAAKFIEAEFGRLDILINNAGITDPDDGPPANVSIQAVRRIFETNLFGTLVVTQAMLPLLRKSDRPQIINQSSGLGSIQLNKDPDWEFAPFKLFGYCASKAALNMMTVQLASTLAEENIVVNSIDPGFTATDLNNHRGRQSIPEGAAAAISQALNIKGSGNGEFFSATESLPW
ncbi:MAG: SDR family oxidoreductase [Proteobacteria bacterium]|nr:SDR family oxidoreductase [Pseudomonadota bacterium]